PPFAEPRRERLLPMLLRARVRSADAIPRTAPPAAERHAIGLQWLPVLFYEPGGVLLEDVRAFFGYERRHPDGRLESAPANRVEHVLHVPAEGRPGLEPVAHRGLITVIYLDVLQRGYLRGDDVEIREHLLRRDARTEAVPR